MGTSLIRSFLLPSLFLFFSSAAVIQVTKNINTAIEFSGHKKIKEIISIVSPGPHTHLIIFLLTELL